MAYPTRDRFDALFSDLCARLGFCLPPADIDRLTNSPPPDVESFTDAVLLADGFDPPALCDLHVRRQVRDTITQKSHFI